MKTALLLEKLEGQLATLRQRCAPVAQFATLSARFDRHLFQTRATTLQACLDEAGDNLAALRHAVEQQQLPQVAWLAEHLAAQLEAIAREATAWSLREWDSAPPKIARWQRKRIQHQDFERRLSEMVAERRARLARVTDLVEQQTLHREVEAYEARLARCRHALEKIENRLARLTASNGESMSLENAPDDVKLAVDLIVLLEENQIPARTVLRALDIVKRDYEKKLQSDEASQSE
ncbi:primosomal replication protein N'' [Escherichia coli HVH 163 (4-4697553)]|nr:primosomal replication protein N'' [Escherichia coli HVH 163 (4-4697553)]